VRRRASFRADRVCSSLRPPAAPGRRPASPNSPSHRRRPATPAPAAAAARRRPQASRMAPAPLAVRVALTGLAIAMAAGIFWHFNFGLTAYMEPLKGGCAGGGGAVAEAAARAACACTPARLAGRRGLRCRAAHPTPCPRPPSPTPPDACGLNGPRKGKAPQFHELGVSFLDGLHCLLTPFFLDCVASPAGRFWVRGHRGRARGSGSGCGGGVGGGWLAPQRLRRAPRPPGPACPACYPLTPTPPPLPPVPPPPNPLTGAQDARDCNASGVGDGPRGVPHLRGRPRQADARHARAVAAAGHQRRTAGAMAAQLPAADRAQGGARVPAGRQGAPRRGGGWGGGLRPRRGRRPLGAPPAV
jgi:hypothetical protein